MVNHSFTFSTGNKLTATVWLLLSFCFHLVLLGALPAGQMVTQAEAQRSSSLALSFVSSPEPRSLKPTTNTETESSQSTTATEQRATIEDSQAIKENALSEDTTVDSNATNFSNELSSTVDSSNVDSDVVTATPDAPVLLAPPIADEQDSTPEKNELTESTSVAAEAFTTEPSHDLDTFQKKSESEEANTTDVLSELGIEDVSKATMSKDADESNDLAGEQVEENRLEDASERMGVQFYSVQFSGPIPVIKKPALAKKKRLTGTVILRGEVNAEGRLVNATVFETSGHALLDEAALAQAIHWHYVPAKKGLESVSQWVQIPIVFR